MAPGSSIEADASAMTTPGRCSRRPADAGQPIGSGSNQGLRLPHPSPRSRWSTTPRSLRAAFSKRTWRVQVVADRQVEGRPDEHACPSGQADPRDSAIATSSRGDHAANRTVGHLRQHWTAGGDPPQRARPPSARRSHGCLVTFDLSPLLADHAEKVAPRREDPKVRASDQLILRARGELSLEALDSFRRRNVLGRPYSLPSAILGYPTSWNSTAC